MMKHENLRVRTKQFALDCIRLCSTLPNKQEFSIIGRQLLRSGTSVGANYRSACRAKSLADFIAKMSVVEEEADECQYWLELLQEIWQVNEAQNVDQLKNEAGQLAAIMIQSKKTARQRLNNSSEKTS